MTEYHKIQTVWERDPATKHRTLIEGKWATPEFEYLADLPWECTEKVDGTNIRLIWEGGKLSFGGKTDRAQLPAPLVEWLRENVSEEALAATLKGDFVLYGEGYGKGIQKGGCYFDHQEFVLFDIAFPGGFLTRETVQEIAPALGLRIVPVVGYFSLNEAVEIVAGEDFRSGWGDFVPEGLVMRPTTELRSRLGERVIAKVKVKDFR